MTCEICGKSQMNVATYTIPFIPLKIDACTQCLRSLELVMAGIALKAKEDMKNYAEELIAANKRIQDNEKSKRMGRGEG